MEQLDNLKIYINYLIDLHLLISEGQSDSNEADEIRDKMDKPWKLMSSEEKFISKSISSVLYKTLGDKDE